MCSVVGYIGSNLCRAYVLQGLSRLEYRGYDSAGFACIDALSKKIVYAKTAGPLENLVNHIKADPIDGYSGIGHTRWSTHGIISQANAHPHFDCTKTISVVHNGIIENHARLKSEFSDRHLFSSQTDSEIIAHVLEDALAQSSLVAAISCAVQNLQGAYAFTALVQKYPNVLIAARRGSPLCIGIGNQEMFVASDVIAFAGITDRVLFLPDESFAIVGQNTLELYDFHGNSLPVHEQKIEISWSDDGKNGYEHYMLKEIYEQKNAIYATISMLEANKHQLWDQLGLSLDAVRNLQSLNLIGCGSSWHAARVAQFFFEVVCQLPTRVMLASEFRYMHFFNETNTGYLAVSQSGETADTLEVMRLIKSKQLPVIALSNVASSSMVREANGFFLTKAGQEVSVASTKAFTTQLAALFWLANMIAYEKGIINKTDADKAYAELLIAAEVLENSIEKYKTIINQQLAAVYARYKKFIFLGRHISYPFAMEAALKLKEISYIFAQCYPAGELKHGPIALIDDETPIIIFSTLDPLIYQKLLSNAQEVKARNGHLIVFAFEGQNELCALADTVFIIPAVHPLLGPLAMTGVMQFFVYSIAKILNRPIDKPRHLAKSVTVE